MGDFEYEKVNQGSFRYKEENNDKKCPMYEKVTVCESIHALLTVFLFECQARTVGTSEYAKLKDPFNEILDKWGNLRGVGELKDFSARLESLKTLVSRFTYIRKECKNILQTASDFMIYALDPKSITGKKTREKISIASDLFNVYISFCGRTFPAKKSGTRLLGIFGVKDETYPCIYYSIDMATIDYSIEPSVEYPNKTFYLVPEIIKKCKTEDNYESNEHNFTTSKAFSTDKVIALKESSSVCKFHPNANFKPLSCGFSHCVPCLLDLLEVNARPKCPCECLISLNDINIIKKERSQNFKIESNLKITKIESNSSQNIRSTSKKPPPQLLPEKINTEDDLINQFDSDSSNFKALKIICPESEDLQRCPKCLLDYFESEFYIKCNCTENICIVCRVRDEERCFICKKKYSKVSKTAIEILKLTTSNNY